MSNEQNTRASAATAAEPLKTGGYVTHDQAFLNAAAYEQPWTNHQGASEAARDDASGTGSPIESGAHEYHEHRSGQANADEQEHHCDSGGAGLRSACELSSASPVAARQQAEPVADELAAFEAWQAVELPSHQRGSYTAADVEFNCYEAALAAWLERAKRANSRENSAPLHLGACITDGKLYITAMQSGPNHTTTVVATAELDMGALLKDDCHAVMTAAQSGQLAGLVQDAARYRWLRERRFYKADNPHTSMYHKGGFDTGWLYSKTLDRDGLDAAIDAAIAAAPTQQQEGGS